MTAPVHRWADASTYYLQIQSIAGDLDIKCEQIDLDRAFSNSFDDIPAGLILIRTAAGDYYYGKDFSYALAAVVFYKMLGSSGILFFNGLMFFGMILMGYLYLRKKNSEIIAMIISVLFFCLSITFVYIFWIHIEIYNMFLIMFGVFVWTTYVENKNLNYLFIAAIAFGLSAVSKLPNAAFFLPLIALELHNRRFKHVAVFIVGILLPILLFYGYFYLNTGSVTYYGGDRLYYSGNYPFTNGFNSTNEAGKPVFSLAGNTESTINTKDLLIIPYNFAYYLIGKYTGLLWYYPLAIFAVIGYVASLKKPGAGTLSSPDKFCILAGVALYFLEFITVLGNNYYGGGHALGNRYFYVYPALLFLLDKIDYRKIAVFLLLPLITLTPILLDPIGNSAQPEKHVLSFPYNVLPIEYTQISTLPRHMDYCMSNDTEIFSLNNGSTDDIRNDGVISRNSNVYIVSVSNISTKELAVMSFTNDTRAQLSYGGQDDRFTLCNRGLKMIRMSDIPVVYSDNRREVYQVDPESNRDIWITLLNDTVSNGTDMRYVRNWYAEENWDGIPFRWTMDSASLIAYSNGVSASNISFEAYSFPAAKPLQVYVNGKLVHESSVSGWRKIALNESLNPGYNLITFESPWGSTRPIDLQEINSSDTRKLSFAFRNITTS